MFGFRKKQPKADAALAVMDDAVEIAAEKWRFFCDKLPFRETVRLADRIASFSVPFNEGARANIAAFKDAPDTFLLLVVALGVERSGTHSRAEIEQALGVPLPD